MISVAGCGARYPDCTRTTGDPENEVQLQPGVAERSVFASVYSVLRKWGSVQLALEN